MSDAGSISFDRAAEFYDATRLTATEGADAAVAMLGDRLPRGELALEIGVGTGALAVPLAARGGSVVGLDLSPSMLRKLVEKDPEGRIGLVVGDATRLPFASGTFGGAYCRWVLHLIAGWRTAVGELCRVVRPGGVVMVDPGGYSGPSQAVWERLLDELGPDAEPIGFDVMQGLEQLDDIFASHGAVLRETPSVPGGEESSLEHFFTEAAERCYSWTWRVADADLRRGIAAARVLAADRYGDLQAHVFTHEARPWRVYAVGGR